MKFFSPTLLVLWAAALASAAPAPVPETNHTLEARGEKKKPHAFCSSDPIGWLGLVPTAHRYTIVVNDLPEDTNYRQVCTLLWKKLRRYGSECVPDRSRQYLTTRCGSTGVPGELLWDFETGVWCNKGMVGSSWWEATHNKWGSIGGCGSISLPPYDAN